MQEQSVLFSHMFIIPTTFRRNKTLPRVLVVLGALGLNYIFFKTELICSRTRDFLKVNTAIAVIVSYPIISHPDFGFYTPRKLCLWWVYCFHVRPCVCASVRVSVRNAFVSLKSSRVIAGFSSNLANMFIYARQIL